MSALIRCTRCLMPNSRPGSRFEDGVCGACRNYDTRATVNWGDRSNQLSDQLTAARNSGLYDCIIPVSGGKDSHRLVEEVVSRGMHPLLVTITDSFRHTSAGVHNLRNLITHYNLNHWQYTISHDLFCRATRWAFEQTGEALKFVESAIYTVPCMLAQQLGIGLVIFGENSAFEYGTTSLNYYDAVPAIMDMVSDLHSKSQWWQSGGITRGELNSILPISTLTSPHVIYMSYFIPWSSVENYERAKAIGFKDLEGEWDRKGTIENFEQIDSYAYMVHLWLKYPKFGFQRVSDIVSRRLREDRISMETAKYMIDKHDSVLDPAACEDFCNTLGYTKQQFWQIVFNAPWNKHYGAEKHRLQMEAVG